jgi:hypothetical protein
MGYGVLGAAAFAGHDSFLGAHGTAKDAKFLRLIVIGFHLNPM